MNSTFQSIRKALQDYVYLTDFFTYEHHGNVMRYTGIIAQGVSKQYNLTECDIYLMTAYSTFHDIGKLGVSKELVCKPAALTPLEQSEMRKHPIYGWHLIKGLKHDFANKEMLQNIILQHHERLNGTGYPYNLKGNEISIEAQIVTVADIYDAITSDRPYDVARSHEYAMNALYTEIAQGRINENCVIALEHKLKEFKEID